MDIKANNVLLSQSLVCEACSPAGPCTGISVYYSGLHRAMGAWSARGRQSLQQVGAPMAPGAGGGQEKSDVTGMEKSDVTGMEKEPQPSPSSSLSSRAGLAETLSRFILILSRGAELGLRAAWGARVPRGAESAWKSRGRQLFPLGRLPISLQPEPRRPSDFLHVSEAGMGRVIRGACDTPGPHS